MQRLYDDIVNQKEKIAVVGLGYVGLPQVIAFSKKVKIIGYDTNQEKIKRYMEGKSFDHVISEELKNPNIEFTWEEEKLKEAKFIIVAVPTPINNDKTPDLTPVKEASMSIGRNLKKGAVVVYESTVYPGVTEDICIPILEEESGLMAGQDFKVGYSPERINPGDQIKKLENIVKIVSGIDDETRDLISSIYELIIEAGTYKVSSIKVAEAAKLVENAQRDINIAFMNELAMVFEKMDITTKEVVDAMNTKWNALGFTPGLVGGHCISVDPYYFIYQAERLGYHSQIILAGRKINDGMSDFITDITIKKMIQANKQINQSKIYIMGITFKEDCSDIRNSKVMDIINRFKEYGIDVMVVDPVVDMDEIKAIGGINLMNLADVKDADCIIFAVGHKEFKKLSIHDINKMYGDIPNNEKILIDVKSIFSKDEVENLGFSYWSL
ncbi:MAG: nucleotide sugar dehydrogenase [Epulopiscium sp.]|nr:nucleotide sugar dehydrogenase [Candidatus Epulonipiscium sp.]